MGGSADLTGSNLTLWPDARPMRGASPDANYISYGVREFGMTAIMNGMALHGGLLPFGGTFLMFSEYARNALRMAALMKQRATSTCSRTIPSASARTARPTSRSSRPPPCA